MMEEMNLDRNFAAEIELPAELYCYYSVTVSSNIIQRAILIDSDGDVVFHAIGKGIDAHSHQIISGTFFTKKYNNEENSKYYLFIGHHKEKLHDFTLSTILSTSDSIYHNKTQIYHGIDYVASNTECFSDGVSCTVRFFYLPNKKPAPPKTINILTAIDVEEIFKNNADCSLDPANPTLVLQNNAIIICGPGKLLTGDRLNEALFIHSAVGDTIEWKSASLSQKGSQNAIIYNCEQIVDDSAGFSGGQTGQGIVRCLLTPTPNENDPTNYKAESTPAYVFRTTIDGTGQNNYRVSFYVTDIIDGKIQTTGYFCFIAHVFLIEQEE